MIITAIKGFGNSGMDKMDKIVNTGEKLEQNRIKNNGVLVEPKKKKETKYKCEKGRKYKIVHLCECKRSGLTYSICFWAIKNSFSYIMSLWCKRLKRGRFLW